MDSKHLQYVEAYTSPPALSDESAWGPVDRTWIEIYRDNAETLLEDSEHMTEWAINACEADRDAAQKALDLLDAGHAIYAATDDDGAYFAHA